MRISWRKSAHDASFPAPPRTYQALFAQASKSVSWVTPRSRVIASNLVCPGAFLGELGSPPERCSMTSVVRLSALTLLIPATAFGFWPKKTLNLKFLYGSKGRILPAIICAFYFEKLCLSGHLRKRDDDEFGRLIGRKFHHDIDDAGIDIIRRGRRFIAIDPVRLAGRRPLERALAIQALEEGFHIEANRRPKRLAIGLENRPLQPHFETFLQKKRRSAHRHVLIVVAAPVVTDQCARPPDNGSVTREGADDIDASLIIDAIFCVGDHLARRGPAQLSLGPRRRLPDPAR